MNDIPRQTLIEIIAQYGPDLVDEPRRVEGLLKDLCGEYKREIKTLMLAAHERVALELRDATGSALPPEVLAASLTQRLLDNLPMSEEMARWAVESWAAALGVALQPLPAKPAAPPVPLPTPPQPAKTTAQFVSFPPQPVEPPQPVPPANPVQVHTQEVSFSLASGVDMVFVHVPAGSFIMGSDPAVDHDAVDDEQPRHSVHLDDFWISKYPVTNRQYLAFVRAADRRAPQHWNNGAIPNGKEKHPVIYVSWENAAAFCRWARGRPGGHSLRLPSEAEWEKAARGTDGRLYPWGNAAPDATRCNFNGNIGSITPVGRYSPRGDSPYGCADMAGNVWEWCDDWYEKHFYLNSPPANPLGLGWGRGRERVVRGGSWVPDPKFTRCACRGKYTPDDFGPNIGFRVVCPDLQP